MFHGYNCATALAWIQSPTTSGQLWIKVVESIQRDLITFWSTNMEAVLIQQR